MCAARRRLCRCAGALGQAAPDAEIPDVQFEGWPEVVLTLPEGVDTLAHRKVAKLQALLRKQFSLLKYGCKQRLNAGENASTTLGVTQLSPTPMVLDFLSGGNSVRRRHSRPHRKGRGTSLCIGKACSTCPPPRKIGQVRRRASAWPWCAR